MDWKDIGEDIAKIGLPLLGAALPFPGGAALGAALASHIGIPSAKPEDLLAKLTQDAAAREKAKEFELQNQTNILQIHINAEQAERKADSADISAVNQTMTAEATSKTGSEGWRKACGYVVALGSAVSLLAVFGIVYLTIFKTTANASAIVTMLPQLVMMVGGVLAIPGAAVGITAWHHGQVDRINATAASGSNGGQ